MSNFICSKDPQNQTLQNNEYMNPVFEMQMCSSNITNWLLIADGIFPQKDRPDPSEHFEIKQGQACVVGVICALIDVSGKSKWGQIPICSDGPENWSVKKFMVQTIFYPGGTDRSRLVQCRVQKMAIAICYINYTYCCNIIIFESCTVVIR